MDIISFVIEHYIAFIIVGIVFLMTIIGYIAQKTGFGNKISKESDKDKKNTDGTEKEENVEILNESDSDTLAQQKDENNDEVEQLDILDTIAPNFNNSGLVVGDINQNSKVSNEELGIQEDLYAPFGDQTTEKKIEPSIDDLKIEDVDDKYDFNIIEKDTNKNDDENIDVNAINDINVTVPPKGENVNVEELKIEDVEPYETLEQDKKEQDKTEDKVAETISNLVDNTFVINDGTDDFNSTNNANTKDFIDKEENLKNEVDENIKQQSEKSKVEQFEIDENSFPEEINNDLELEATTNLKLDEINEQIKNLKLEDFDSPIVDEEKSNLLRKTTKRKPINIKSVDQLKNEKDNTSNNDVKLELPDLNTVIENNNISTEDNTVKDENSITNDNVDSDEDIWNF